MNKYNRLKNIYGFLFMIILFPGMLACKKLVEIPPPPNGISSANVFTQDESAIAVLTGIYNDMSKTTVVGAGGFVGLNGVSVIAGLSADELTFHQGLGYTEHYMAYYTNALIGIGTSFGSDHWAPLYNYIFRCNSTIEGLSAPQAGILTPNIRQQLLGEAKFLRAFFYFYLVNMFGDVPLVLATDYKVNALLPKALVNQVYKQIIADLLEAKGLLSESFLDVSLLKTTQERVRPTRWAALALLARIYLYTKDYPEAEKQASILIDQAGFLGLSALNDVFLKNSREAIWQLQPTTIYFNTEDAPLFVIPPSGPSTNNPVYLNPFLLAAFEPGDQRALLGNWIDKTIYQSDPFTTDSVYFPFKYKKYSLDSAIAGASAIQNMTEYQMVLRLGEQYLIRAEARAHQKKIMEARADLDSIRFRAGLPPSEAADEPSLLAAIQHERQVELFAEWGHRWFDLKRTGTIDAVMAIVTPLKSQGFTAWQSYQQLYPIPPQEIQRAPNLVQNTGY